MKRNIQQLNNFKKILLLLISVTLLSLFATSAWATISLVKPMDATYQVDIPEITARNDTPQSRAPEPTTLAMFSSGLIGMIVQFFRKAYDKAKRMIDIAGSIVALIVLAPIYLLAALAVKLTSQGPILYTQTRVGKDGQLFKIYKFRTMRVDAEKDTGPVWATRNDSRLTLIGGILRKSRIDEIPQFINVLKGEMSIIGPRPERPEFVEKLKVQIPNYEHRLRVKPGITGLAQVRHRYDETIEDVKKKIHYDLLYIKNLKFSTDFRIILRTFRVVLTGFGAL